MTEMQSQSLDLAPLAEITLRLDEPTKQRLKRLASSMALSIRAVIEVAINYTYACITEHDLGVDDLQTEGLPIGDFPFKILLALETTEKLERLGMSQSASECTIIGINLLYDRLIDIPHD
jgi:antitoxin component of RelBE/YafQ-DinJ toxin-antitoxin module